MPNRQKQRGDRFERQMVQRLKDIGSEAERVPLSGAVGGSFSGDIIFFTLRRMRTASDPRHKFRRFTAECKLRANESGYSKIIEWLGTNDVLFLGRDRDEPFVLMPWKLFGELFHEYEVPVTLERSATEPRNDTVYGHGDGI